MNPQRGFTLVEVLITVFVIAVGLLSLAALQIIAKKSNFDAHQHTLAGQAAQDIVSRMRSNAGALSHYLDQSTDELDEPGTHCASATCTPDALAAWDLWQWAQQILGGGATDDEGEPSGGLAQPLGCILSGSRAGHVRVAIAWRGLTPLPPPDEDDTERGIACGLDAYLENEGTDDHRRVMVVDVFIAQATGG